MGIGKCPHGDLADGCKECIDEMREVCRTEGLLTPPGTEDLRQPSPLKDMPTITTRDTASDNPFPYPLTNSEPPRELPYDAYLETVSSEAHDSGTLNEIAVEQPERKSIRRRVNISRTVKGIITFDCTVECVDGTMEGLLEESDKLVAKLTEKYPFKEEK